MAKTWIKKDELEMLQKPAEEYLKLKKVEFLHLTTYIVIKGRTFPVKGNKGFPDLQIMMGLGRTFYVEFKMPGKKLEPEQVEYKNRLERLGYEYFILYKIEDFIRLIDGRIRRGE